jgi:hypothetical protein
VQHAGRGPARLEHADHGRLRVLGHLRRKPGGDALHAGANEYIMKSSDKDIVTAKFQEVGLI